MKLWTTEAGFRVAGILSWPARIDEPRVSDEVVSSLDLLPSLCQLGEAAIPDDLALDGTSFVPLIDGDAMQRSQPLVWCYYNAINEQRVAMRHGPWKMLARLDGGNLPKLQNVHAGNQQRVQSARLTDFELYRIVDDVSEASDCFATAPEAQRLAQVMQRAYQELLDGSHVWRREPAAAE